MGHPANVMSLTPAARKVLSDCRFVLAKLEDEPEDQSWRVYWVAAVALLRAIGHVLESVDGQTPAVRKISKELYSEWRSGNSEHEIFRYFVKHERDNVLKEYALGISEGPVSVLVLGENTEHGELESDNLDVIGENMYRPLKEGPYEGEDGRTVLEMAIAWWEAQLDEIDRRAKELIQNGRVR